MARADCLLTPRSPTEPSPPSCLRPHRRRHTPLQVVAGCGGLRWAGGTQTPTWCQALTCLLLPCGPWPLPRLCPWPQSWPGCTHRHLALPYLCLGGAAPSRFSLHELEGPRESRAILHPAPPSRPVHTHLSAAPLRLGWRQSQTRPGNGWVRRGGRRVRERPRGWGASHPGGVSR